MEHALAAPIAAVKLAASDIARNATARHVFYCSRVSCVVFFHLAGVAFSGSLFFETLTDGTFFREAKRVSWAQWLLRPDRISRWNELVWLWVRSSARGWEIVSLQVRLRWSFGLFRSCPIKRSRSAGQARHIALGSMPRRRAEWRDHDGQYFDETNRGAISIMHKYT